MKKKKNKDIVNFAWIDQLSYRLEEALTILGAVFIGFLAFVGIAGVFSFNFAKGVYQAIKK